MRVNDIKKIKSEFYKAGLLFLWNGGQREWGFFTSWANHQYCNASGVDEEGKYTKHRRKTPEPPQDLLQQYIKEHSDNLRQSPTKSLNPNPNPNPKHIYILHLDFVKLTEKEYNQLIEDYGQSNTEKYIISLNNHIGSKNKRYASHYFTLRSWMDKAEIKKPDMPKFKYPVDPEGQKKVKDIIKKIGGGAK